MEPEPTEGKSSRGERVFYFVLWLMVAGLVMGPVVLWVAGHGSTLGAFASASLALLVWMRLARRRDVPPN